MCSDEVPQDNSSTYAGHKKLLYAQNAGGEYVSIQSSGWEVEAAATIDAVTEYERLAAAARTEVVVGRKSPLLFHMYHNRMDLPLLAQVSGIWRWRIKRHFLPQHFARLNDTFLMRYADAFNISLAELKSLPEK